MKKIDVALVGLGFGSCFVPIWLDHPNVGQVTVCDTNEKLLQQMKERYPRIRITTSFEEVLKDETIDAVHLVTPIPLHADQSVAVLESGKHCACTVPMATSLEDIRRIVAAKRKSGKNYMMMETNILLVPHIMITLTPSIVFIVIRLRMMMAMVILICIGNWIAL